MLAGLDGGVDCEEGDAGADADAEEIEEDVLDESFHFKKRREGFLH